MTTLTKTCAIAATVGLVGGGLLDFSGINAPVFCAVILPLGAVALGLTLISSMLEEATANHDADVAANLKKLPAKVSRPANYSKVAGEISRALSMAQKH